MRKFYWNSKAYYAKVCGLEHEIVFGYYSDDGSCFGEMTMKWVDLESKLRSKLVPQLQVFDDAWKILYEFSDLLKTLAKYDNKKISEKQFVKILKEHGFKDDTSYELNNF